jgi:hypothetical protein
MIMLTMTGQDPNTATQVCTNIPEFQTQSSLEEPLLIGVLICGIAVPNLDLCSP